MGSTDFNLNAGCWRREGRVARGTGMIGTSSDHAQSFFALLLPFIYLFIYLFNRFHHDYNIKKRLGKKYI